MLAELCSFRIAAVTSSVADICITRFYVQLNSRNFLTILERVDIKVSYWKWRELNPK